MSILQRKEPVTLRRKHSVWTRLNGALKTAWKVLLTVTMTLLLGLNLLVGSVNMVVFLGGLYIGDAGVSLNEKMIDEGYAWAYDGGTKQKNFEELREIRRNQGTYVDPE